MEKREGGHGHQKESGKAVGPTEIRSDGQKLSVLQQHQRPIPRSKRGKRLFSDFGRAKLEQVPYTKKGFNNTAQHVWGYFKKVATQEEKDEFFERLENCSSLPDEFDKGEPAAEHLLSYIKETLLISHPKPYLNQSSILK
ncbi:DUF1722 domain-containing protein [Fictibacillus enclensis]|uniref:DUF1722 domain-containing protein n=1 Tax=Fictibacillus enclensis TaxID=1017270 RepID=UPI0025A2B9E1|nr:DUF1722 domain-containing protein [Fictibacillus enclensis]